MSEFNDLSEGLRTRIKNLILNRNNKPESAQSSQTPQKPSRPASKQISVLRTAHYTNPESKQKIHSMGGFRPSDSRGVYHPKGHEDTVYTTASSRIGKDYGSSRVNLKIVNPKIDRTESHRKYHDKYTSSSEQERKNLKVPQEHSKELIGKGSKIVRVPDAHSATKAPGSYIMVDRELANRSIDPNPRQVIKANKPRIAPPRLKNKDKVIEYLLHNGLCETIESAEVVFENMSDYFIDYIID
jgi:hypothetical protein